jgi:hypothetical protein
MVRICGDGAAFEGEAGGPAPSRRQPHFVAYLVSPDRIPYLAYSWPHKIRVLVYWGWIESTPAASKAASKEQPPRNTSEVGQQ